MRGFSAPSKMINNINLLFIAICDLRIFLMEKQFVLRKPK